MVDSYDPDVLAAIVLARASPLLPLVPGMVETFAAAARHGSTNFGRRSWTGPAGHPRRHRVRARRRPVLQVGCLAAEGHQALEDPPPEHILRFRVATACVPSAAHDISGSVLNDT